MKAPDQVLRLIDTFDSNLDAYRAGSYNEAQLRQEFLNPFFAALGWDVDNTSGYAEPYKDVIHEDSIKIGAATKAPDYCFRIGGARKFFVEAKKPAVDIKSDFAPAFQLRRYAWSAKLPLSILTDFEELAVYDCRIRPLKTDPAAKARTIYIKYTEYPDRWEEIAGIFSRDAILKGSFDKYAQSTKRKKGTAEVDAAFLTEIEAWREMLARNIALRNASLTNRDINFAVQRTIDRIIFLRICEDRGIEPYGQLLALRSGAKTYPRLAALFQKADDRYNSGLFHFHPEPDRPEPPDELTLALKIDDKALKDIIQALYYPDSPYEFAVLPTEILGQVYEQFLGKVITLTKAHQAKVQDKPEVKKAGGVYYTPTYIVDYIVKNTVGKLLEQRSVLYLKTRPPRLDQPLTILDPACGSGSFLIGAYQFLLDWHLDYYINHDPKQWATHKSPPIYQTDHADYRLTTAERKRILLDHIYGVDIDSQAVEVTKLSLLLKVLEKETQASLDNQLKLFHERALPDLADNIKCGNSLIGPDFYEDQQLNLFDEEEIYRINAFNWKTEFPQIFTGNNPGFSAVIGNPPYIPIESMQSCEKEYYQKTHPQLERKYDSSIIFILAMLAKLDTRGTLGFISSLTWQTGENYRRLRELLFSNHGLRQVVNLPFDTFKHAYVDTGVYVLTRYPTDTYSIYRFPKKTTDPSLEKIRFTDVPTALVAPPDFKLVLNPVAQRILNRGVSSPQFTPLGNITHSTQGLAPSRFTFANKPKNDAFFPFLMKGQVYRYALTVEALTYTDMSVHKNLCQFYDATPKLLIRRVINRQDRLMATYDDKCLVFKKDINPFVVATDLADPLFVLAILNSRLISYLYVNSSSIATKDDFRQTTLAELRRLPIPIWFASDKIQTRIVQLVRIILNLNKQLATPKTPQQKKVIERQITTTDQQIDRLVYQLYDLTEAEIKIVEDATK